MEYEGCIGFVMKKMKFFIADFHVVGLFNAKKHDLSDKKFSVCHAPLPCAKFALHLQARYFIQFCSTNLNKSDGTFGNYYRFQKPVKILKVLKFDILRVPPIHISTKKG
jgi:hypothetical protein